MLDELDDNKVLVLSWVLKKSVKTHQWKKRWAVLRNCQFSYYKSSSEHKPSSVVNKANLLLFAAIPGGHNYHFAIYCSKKTYHLRVDSQELFDQWLSALKAVIMSEDQDDSHDDGGELSPNQSADRAPNLLELTTARENKEFLVEKGPLSVYKSLYSQWKKYYVIVTNKNVYLCKSEDKTQRPEKTIPIEKCLDVVELDGMKGKKWCLMLIEIKGRRFLSASTEQEMMAFLLALKAVMIQQKGHKQIVEKEMISLEGEAG